jgi:hypothetical protein
MTALVPLWDRGVAIYFYSNFLRKRIIFKLRVRVFGLTTLHAINIFSNKLNSKNFLFGNALFFKKKEKDKRKTGGLKCERIHIFKRHTMECILKNVLF